MSSLILSVAARYLLPLLLLFSVYILLRGHDEPGGGFVGGLVAAAAFALYNIAYGVERARQTLHTHPRLLFSLGLLLAAGSGLVGLVLEQPYMTGFWSRYEVPVLGKLGTPLLFDIGVYLVVIGMTLTIILALSEE
jgi:multicomponent Na+:H+ antiporter subunit B